MLKRVYQMAASSYWQQLERLSEKIKTADAIVVGAGAGLSASAGFIYSGERFKRYFSDFEEKYGFHDMYTGGFYPYKTQEEFWAYWSRYIYCNRYDLDANETYLNLLELVKEKNYFVLTTNVDHQFQIAGFDKKRLFYTQGDYGLFQCSAPCCQVTYDNEKMVREMKRVQTEMRIPTEFIPKCPVCGKPMTMNLRADDKFVEDEGWYTAANRYSVFLQRHKKMQLLFLELGVGYNTPMIIKYPFWQMTAQNPQAIYACLNAGEAICPPEIAQQSICINRDIGNVLHDLLQMA